MKKSLIVLVAAVCMFGSGFNAKADVTDKLVMYFPNRFMDLLDIVSLEVGFGPCARVEVRATRVMNFGASWGICSKAIKDYNRQYGVCIDNTAWDFGFAFLSSESTERAFTSRDVKPFLYTASGIPLISERVYNFYEGSRDYWEIGVDAALLVDFHCAIHPVEVADLVTGFFFFDLKGDDFGSKDLED